jgi:IMP dehydrogenase
MNDIKYSLTYDDISLLPNQISELEHRADCDTSVNFLGIKLDMPIIASPMNTVCDGKMARKLADINCLGIVHRFNTIKEQIAEFENNNLRDSIYRAAAIGINAESDYERLQQLADIGVQIFCIDVANGGSKLLEKFLNKIQNCISKYDLKIIAGNVASYEATKFLMDLNVDAIRVGIGNGAMCSTSIKCGVGIGQVDALNRALEARDEVDSKTLIIADGGINNPGKMCKALALGADVVMFGRVLAGTDESPGDVIKYNSQLWKKYCGSASFASKQDKKNYIEGEESLIPYKGSVLKIIQDYKEGLQSSMSYLNSNNLKEYSQKAEFVQLSLNSFNERMPQFNN